jgi:proteasome accessory factor A
MGIENEYTILLFSTGRRADTKGAAIVLMALARDLLPHLPHHRNGIFLASGARLYIDAANHPEWCTAECTNPTDVVCQVRAGERHLKQIVEQIPGAVLLRCNVSYARPSSTWGSHESHRHKCGRPILRRVLRPHLLTRIIYTGSGGLDPFHPGIVFSLSPRSLHFDRCSSTLHAASCLDARDESLAGRPHRRGHVILGESVSLDLPLWLRMATTSLLVTMTDAGLLTAQQVPALDDPAAALRAIALDTSLTAPVGAAGSSLSALRIQRSYLELVERHVDHPSMPDWAPLACDRWRAMLDRLAAGAASAVEHCEWALKHQIMSEHIRRRGLDWEALDRYNRVAEQAVSRPEIASGESADRGGDLWEGAPLAERISAEAKRHGYRPAEVQRLQQLRRDLTEIDMRFDMLPGGIWDAIASRITNHVGEVTDDRIRHSMKWPPDDTRAAIRGRYIRRLSGDRDRYTASWVAIRDTRKGLRLDLSDPFCRRARWKKPRTALRPRLLPFG